MVQVGGKQLSLKDFAKFCSIKSKLLFSRKLLKSKGIL